MVRVLDENTWIRSTIGDEQFELISRLGLFSPITPGQYFDSRAQIARNNGTHTSDCLYFCLKNFSICASETSTAIDILEFRNDAGDANDSAGRLESRLGMSPGSLFSMSSVTASRCLSIVACYDIPYFAKEEWMEVIYQSLVYVTVAVPGHSHHCNKLRRTRADTPTKPSRLVFACHLFYIIH